MANRVFQLDRENPRWRAVKGVMDQFIGEEVTNGRVLRITIGEPKRTLDENAKLHAMLSEVADQVEWAGKKRDVEVWKRLMVSAWCRARGEPVEILPALDGHGIDIVPVRTSKLNKRDCAELIEFVYAWGADNDVRFTEVAE
jgi:hypothetical protein